MRVFPAAVLRGQNERAGGGHGGGVTVSEEGDGGSCGDAEQRSRAVC